MSDAELHALLNRLPPGPDYIGLYDKAYNAGANDTRRACLAVIESQLADLAANYPGAWIAEFAANTCRAVATAIEELPLPPARNVDA